MRAAPIVKGDEQFRSLRTQTVCGVDLQIGDLLPVDSPVRNNPARLDLLCRVRYMEVVAKSAFEKKAIINPVPPPIATPTKEAKDAKPAAKTTKGRSQSRR